MKTPKPATRVSLGLKVTADLKNQVDSAARASGRTQSQEAEKRLDQSFRDQALLNQVLELTFGRHLGGLLLLIGRAMTDAGRDSAFLRARILKDADDWLDNAYGYDQAVQAVHQVLEELRPEGDSSPPNLQISDSSIKGPRSDELVDFFLKHGGVGFANSLLDALQGRGATAEVRDWAEPVSKMLGPMVDRINWTETKNER